MNSLGHEYEAILTEIGRLTCREKYTITTYDIVVKNLDELNHKIIELERYIDDFQEDVRDIVENMIDVETELNDVDLFETLNQIVTYRTKMELNKTLIEALEPFQEEFYYLRLELQDHLTGEELYNYFISKGEFFELLEFWEDSKYGDLDALIEARYS